jgi:hypothetical protein
VSPSNSILSCHHPEEWKFDARAHCTLQIWAPDGDRIRGVRLSLCLVKLKGPRFLPDVTVLDSVYIPEALVSQIPLDLIEPQAVAFTFHGMKAKHFS